jgi:hypothetical protein
VVDKPNTHLSQQQDSQNEVVLGKPITDLWVQQRHDKARCVLKMMKSAFTVVSSELHKKYL